MMRYPGHVPLTNTMSGGQVTDPEEVQLMQMFSQMEDAIRNAPPPPQMVPPTPPATWKLGLGAALSNFGSVLSRMPVFAQQNAQYMDDVRSAPMATHAANLEAQIKDSKARMDALREISFQRLKHQQELAEKEGDYATSLKLEKAKHDLMLERMKSRTEEESKLIERRAAGQQATAAARGAEQRKTNASKAAGKSAPLGKQPKDTFRAEFLKNLESTKKNELKIIDDEKATAVAAAKLKFKDDPKKLTSVLQEIQKRWAAKRTRRIQVLDQGKNILRPMEQ